MIALRMSSVLLSMSIDSPGAISQRPPGVRTPLSLALAGRLAKAAASSRDRSAPVAALDSPPIRWISPKP